MKVPKLYCKGIYVIFLLIIVAYIDTSLELPKLGEVLSNQNGTLPKTALCAVALNEELYLREWVHYHIGIGFDSIFIYDNSDSYELNGWPYYNSTIVEVVHLPGTAKQSTAYRDCVMTLKTRASYKWVAFFDVDEFLVLRQHRSTFSFLQENLESGGLGLNWVFMGSSNRSVYEPYPVSFRFQYRVDATTNYHIKSFAVIDDINMTGKFHAHYPPLRHGFYNRDTNGKAINGPFNENGPYDVAVFYHFFSKSRKEFVLKKLRGRVSRARETYDYDGEAEQAKKDGFLKGHIYDDTVWQTLIRHVPSYKFFEDIPHS
jgi:Glycosyl transferase family 2